MKTLSFKQMEQVCGGMPTPYDNVPCFFAIPVHVINCLTLTNIFLSAKRVYDCWNS